MSRAIKIVLWTVVIALTIAVALWIVGGKRMRYSTSLVINAPPAEVFTYLTEADLLKKWVEGLVSIVPIDESPEQQRNKVGAQARVTMESNNKRIEFDDEILRYDENKLLSIKITNRLMTLTSIYELTPEEVGKTSLELVVKKTNRGLGRFIGPFMTSPIAEKIKSDCQRLKGLIESEMNPIPPDSDAPSSPDCP